MHNILAIFKNDVLALKTSVIAAIVAIGLILVPPMYAWLTTLGFWDPYANTGSIKVAVANEDEGYSSALIPTKINAGDQVISALHENDSFDWIFVSQQEAVDGAHSGEYYAAIVIPKDFTKNLMTVFSDHATKARSPITPMRRRTPSHRALPPKELPNCRTRSTRPSQKRSRISRSQQRAVLPISSTATTS